MQTGNSIFSLKKRESRKAINTPKKGGHTRMKSFIFAILISITIIGVGSVMSKKVENSANTISQDNEKLQQCLENKDKASAISALDKAEKKFKHHKVLFEAISDHEELLRIELQYKAMREFIKEDQFGDALAACSEIKLLLSHLPQSFKVKAENIL